ncbi:MAG: histidinol-phosphatase [Hyphomicrobiaceae bacterium]
MTKLSAREIKALLATAHELADLSAAPIMKFFRKPLDVENKASGGDFDPVTAADKAAERVIRKRLAQAFPDHGILGEEYGAQASDSPYTWVIDPIDGTKAFITGTPLWGTLIGLAHHGRAVLGVMNQPFTGERIWAAGGASFWRTADGRQRRNRTRDCARLEDAMLATTSPDLLQGPGELEAFLALKARARLTRYGGDCYAYCLLAAGHVDLVVETGLKPHDVMALIPIIEQAGGRMTNWDGGPAEAGGRIVAAGNAKLHDLALRRIARTLK